MKTESRTSETHMNIETLVATHSVQVTIAKKALTAGMRVCQETHDMVMGIIRKDPYVDVEEEHRERGCGGGEEPLPCTKGPYVLGCSCVRVVSGCVGRCRLCAVCCVQCAVCCVLCAVCCVLCAVCCMLCVLYAVHCVLYAVWEA